MKQENSAVKLGISAVYGGEDVKRRTRGPFLCTQCGFT